MSFRLSESDRTSTAWYRLLADGEALYFRINKCDADETFGALLDEAFEQAEAAGKLKKVIVDIRSNPGGYPDLEGNYLRLVNYLNDSGADVYVLINGESYSGAIALPSMLRRRVEKAGPGLQPGPAGGDDPRFRRVPEFSTELQAPWAGGKGRYLEPPPDIRLRRGQSRRQKLEAAQGLCQQGSPLFP